MPGPVAGAEAVTEASGRLDVSIHSTHRSTLGAHMPLKKSGVGDIGIVRENQYI